MAFRKLLRRRTPEETRARKREWAREHYTPKPCPPPPCAVGEVFGRLTVQSVEKTNGGKYSLTVRCQCGTVTSMQPAKIIKGLIKSCGCYHREYMRASYFEGRRQVSL